jgi:predicted phosphodiesterase
MARGPQRVQRLNPREAADRLDVNPRKVGRPIRSDHGGGHHQPEQHGGNTHGRRLHDVRPLDKSGVRVFVQPARFAVVCRTPGAYRMPITRVPGELIRIISDIHFGDRASRVHRLAQLRPLLDGVTHLVLNGDTLDTRPGPSPAHTAECRAAVAAFFSRQVARTTYITGNHDADFSPHHYLELGGGSIFVIHGDILFDNIVPWSRDAPFAGRRIAEELQRLPAALRQNLDQRLAVFRRVAITIPQRHHSERRQLRYTLRYLADTVWPPHRVLKIVQTWQVLPGLAADLLRRHRPNARYILTGHTHWPGIWRRPDGITVINTGSFSLLVGACAVDLTAGKITVRRIVRRAGEFRPGRILAEFPLAAP